jgi:hypothetical protein
VASRAIDRRPTGAHTTFLKHAPLPSGRGADFPEKEAKKYADRIAQGDVLVVVSGDGEVDENKVRASMEANEASVDTLEVD